MARPSRASGGAERRWTGWRGFPFGGGLGGGRLLGGPIAGQARRTLVVRGRTGWIPAQNPAKEATGVNARAGISAH